MHVQSYLSIFAPYRFLIDMRNIQNYNYFDPYLIVHLTNYKRKLQNSIPSSIRFVITILLW